MYNPGYDCEGQEREVDKETYSCIADCFIAVRADEGNHTESVGNELVWKNCSVYLDFDHVYGYGWDVCHDYAPE